MTTTNPYGICPTCNEPGVSMARNPVGPTTCGNGHKHDHAKFHVNHALEASRAEFIKSMDNTRTDVTLLSHGGFANPNTQTYWLVWQKAVVYATNKGA